MFTQKLVPLILFCAVQLALLSPVNAQEGSAPTLEYIMTYQANLSPPQVIVDDRLILNMPEGGWLKTKDGSTGKFIPPSADWLYILPNGTFKLDVRATVQMDDGAQIYLEYTGRVSFTEEGGPKFVNGEELSTNDAYFITSQTMHTASDKYAWMNDAVFVGKMIALQGANDEDQQAFVRYDIYKVVP